MPLLIGVGVITYLADLFFFWVLDRLDISVVNAAWAIQSVALSIIGVVFFAESWTLSQMIGASLVCSGVLLLSFFHAHVSFRSTILILFALGLFYVPLGVARKAALFVGQPILPVVFWRILGRDCSGFIVPLIMPAKRRMILHMLPSCPFSFFFLSCLMICTFYLAEYVTTFAYSIGPLFLISLVGNMQPFFVLFFAGCMARFAPSLAPKEVFSLQGTSLKLLSFVIVFIGLALLILYQ